MKKLLAQKDRFNTVATVRSKSSGSKLVSTGIPESALVEFDLAAAAAAADGAPSPAAAGLSAALQDADALIIATSGVPQIKWLSLIPVMIAKLTGKEGVRPEFTWKQGQMPEQVRQGRCTGSSVKPGSCAGVFAKVWSMYCCCRSLERMQHGSGWQQLTVVTTHVWLSTSPWPSFGRSSSSCLHLRGMLLCRQLTMSSVH